jgi:hypothetical protein
VLAASITSVADTWLVWKALVPLPMMLLRVSAYLRLRMSMDREVSACTSHRSGFVEYTRRMSPFMALFRSSRPLYIPSRFRRSFSIRACSLIHEGLCWSHAKRGRMAGSGGGVPQSTIFAFYPTTRGALRSFTLPHFVVQDHVVL